jgi:Kdo2-lipid IVA lauroyltransferase/acyltransferase
VKKALEACGWMVGAVPLVFWEFCLKMLAILVFDCLRIRRRVALSNIQIAFPELSPKQALQMARSSYFNFGMTVVEFLGSRRLFSQMLMTVENGEYLQNALKKGDGAYVLCIHMGNWEFMCSKGSQLFSKVSILAKDIGKGSAADFVTELRAFNGCYVIPRKAEQSATQKIYECLGNNEIVGFMVDQSRPGSPRVPLFGKGALTNVGLLQLCMRRAAPIIPVVSHRNSAGVHTMRFLPEFCLEQPEGLKFKETVILNAARMNLVVEQMIQTCPDQYFWMHRRWK